MMTTCDSGDAEVDIAVADIDAPARDGCSYFENLSFGATLKRMLSIYKRGFCQIGPLQLLIRGDYAILWAILLAILVPAFGLEGGLENDPYYVQDNSGAFAVLYMLQY